MKNLLLILILLLLLSSSAQADTTFVTLPLPTELLSKPVELDCGATIREWRGSRLTESRIERVNSMCSLVNEKFGPFVKELGYSPSDAPFYYSLSFIPYGKNYRDLNDIEYRFAGRAGGTNLTGYTVHEGRYVFNISNPNDRDFDVSFAHELFHAMSYHYGIHAQHEGDVDMIEENLARKFTKRLMGRE